MKRAIKILENLLRAAIMVRASPEFINGITNCLSELRGAQSEKESTK